MRDPQYDARLHMLCERSLTCRLHLCPRLGGDSLAC